MIRLWALFLLVLFAPSAHAEDLQALQTRHYEFRYPAALQGFATALADRVEGYHERIYGELGVTSGGRTTVTLLDDEAEMLQAAADAHGGHRPPEWARGLAYPRTREVFLHAGVGPDQLQVTFQHEISHVALGEIARHADVPRWFSEGLAIRQSEGVDLQRAWLLTEAATVDALHPLAGLDRGFPESGARAGVAYAQAVHFVGWLQGEHGAPRFRELIATMRDRQLGLGDAVEAVYGRPLSSLEADWRGDLEVWWGWLPVAFGSTTLWVFAALLLVYAWRRHGRLRAARLDQLRGREAEAMAEDIEVAHGLAPPRHTHDPYDGRPPTIH